MCEAALLLLLKSGLIDTMIDTVQNGWFHRVLLSLLLIAKYHRSVLISRCLVMIHLPHPVFVYQSYIVLFSLI